MARIIRNATHSYIKAHLQCELAGTHDIARAGRDRHTIFLRVFGARLIGIRDEAD